MFEQNKKENVTSPSPASFVQWISMPSLLFVFIVWLTWIEFGHLGLKILLFGMAGLFVFMLLFFVYDHIVRATERQIDLGSRMVTRADYVDAVGDSMKMQAQAGKQVKVVEAKQLDAQTEELFNIIPFSMPTETTNK